MTDLDSKGAAGIWRTIAKARVWCRNYCNSRKWKTSFVSLKKVKIWIQRPLSSCQNWLNVFGKIMHFSADDPYKSSKCRLARILFDLDGRNLSRHSRVTRKTPELLEELKFPREDFCHLMLLLSAGEMKLRQEVLVMTLLLKLYLNFSNQRNQATHKQRLS